MKLILPDNVFSRIFLSELTPREELQLEFSPSSLISKKLLEGNDSLGLIPTLDLITFNDLFVSREVGISFNGLLSNSYIHFKENQKTFDEIFLLGDVASNEVILSKILLQEFYDVNVKATLLSQAPADYNRNILITGDENFKKSLFLNGLSFAEEIIELISAPYVNFVLAANSERSIKNFTSNYKNSFESGHKESFVNLFPELAPEVLVYLTVNIQHLIFDFDEQDLEGIKLLLQMPYYHGLIKDMIDVKFV